MIENEKIIQNFSQKLIKEIKMKKNNQQKLSNMKVFD